MESSWEVGGRGWGGGGGGGNYSSLWDSFTYLDMAQVVVKLDSCISGAQEALDQTEHPSGNLCC